MSAQKETASDQDKYDLICREFDDPTNLRQPRPRSVAACKANYVGFECNESKVCWECTYGELYRSQRVTKPSLIPQDTVKPILTYILDMSSDSSRGNVNQYWSPSDIFMPLEIRALDDEKYGDLLPVISGAVGHLILPTLLPIISDYAREHLFDVVMSYNRYGIKKIRVDQLPFKGFPGRPLCWYGQVGQLFFDIEWHVPKISVAISAKCGVVDLRLKGKSFDMPEWELRSGPDGTRSSAA